MLSVVIANKKGGVGKTTTAYNLAAGLKIWGYKVLAIDLDPQCSLSKVAGYKKEGPTSYGVISKEVNIKDAIVPMEHFDLVPASPALATADQTIPEGLGKLMRIREALLEVKDDYDFVIMDDAPAMGVVTMNSLVAADYIVIPAEANELSTDGIVSIYESVLDIKKYMQTNLKIAGILLTRYKAKTNLNQSYSKVFNKLAEQMGTKVFRARIRESVNLSELPSIHQPIFIYKPGSNAKDDYTAFVREFMRGVEADVNPE